MLFELLGKYQDDSPKTEEQEKKGWQRGETDRVRVWWEWLLCLCMRKRKRENITERGREWNVFICSSVYTMCRESENENDLCVLCVIKQNSSNIFICSSVYIMCWCCLTVLLYVLIDWRRWKVWLWWQRFVCDVMCVFGVVWNNGWFLPYGAEGGNGRSVFVEID